jgi:hypothetical protein
MIANSSQKNTDDTVKTRVRSYTPPICCQLQSRKSSIDLLTLQLPFITPFMIVRVRRIKFGYVRAVAPIDSIKKRVEEAGRNHLASSIYGISDSPVFKALPGATEVFPPSTDRTLGAVPCGTFGA